MKVYIDVGHGGDEQSMVANGLAEEEVNLQVSKAVHKVLVAEGLNVELSRWDDTYVGIDGSAAKCNASGADFAVSIHHNGFSSPVVGYDIIYSDFKPPSLALANAIGEEFNALGRPKHGITTRVEGGVDWYGIIRQINVPCVIVEYCYMSTPSEAELIRTDKGRNTEAFAIARGILKFAGLPMPKSNVLEEAPVTPPPAADANAEIIAALEQADTLIKSAIAKIKK